MITLIEQQRETGAGFSLAAMCRVLEVPRGAYYRARQEPPVRNETALRDGIQQIAVEMPATYRSRRLSAIRGRSRSFGTPCTTAWDSSRSLAELSEPPLCTRRRHRIA